jgi:hypothetical protein
VKLKTQSNKSSETQLFLVIERLPKRRIWPQNLAKRSQRGKTKRDPDNDVATQGALKIFKRNRRVVPPKSKRAWSVRGLRNLLKNLAVSSHPRKIDNLLLEVTK